MNRLNSKKQTQIISCLIEGTSIRGTARITGVSKVTVLKLLADIGRACTQYQDKTLRNLTCKRIQCDEIWAFCYAKEKNVPEDKKGHLGYGDLWTWTAICAESKLIVSWLVGRRDLDTATAFIHDLAGRLKNRIQLTTDGYRAYVNAVEHAFGKDIDFSQLIKLYGNEINRDSKTKYSPAECTGTIKQTIQGNPNEKHISTSYVERQNLTMRTNMRRFTRLTNGFSKKVENHIHSVALHFMHYNFCRVHRTLRVTPAMEAGLTDHVWEIGEILDLIK